MSKGNKRVRLKQDEEKLINDYRRIKDEATKQGVPIEDVKHGWLKSDKSSLFFTNPNYKDEEQKEAETFRAALLKDFSNFSPKYTKVKRKPSSDGHLMVISPADVHIGKLCTSFETGEEYNQQIAVKRVMEGVDGLLNSASGWNLDSIHLIIGNDILHTDTPRRTTTSGTPQDTDGMWYENFLNGVRLYVDVINTLKQVADVHVSYNPSNHDYTNGFFLAQLIETHFRLDKNVTFDVSIAHRKYYAYGENLIGSSHGDGAKIQDLPLLMAHESKHWTECKHRYIYTHHLHHKTSKDVMSVCVETLRSPSGTDSWHHRNGYQHAPKAIEAFIHHKRNGQIARLTHLF
jgi:hypothetical protein